MSTKYVGWFNAVAESEQLGNAMALLLSADSGDGLTFSKGAKLAPIGGPNIDAARGAAGPLTDRGLALIAEFNTDGPWTNIIALGATPELIAAAKAAVHVECGGRELADTTIAYWDSVGYEPMEVFLLGYGTPQ